MRQIISISGDFFMGVWAHHSEDRIVLMTFLRFRDWRSVKAFSGLHEKTTSGKAKSFLLPYFLCQHEGFFSRPS